MSLLYYNNYSNYIFYLYHFYFDINNFDKYIDLLKYLS